MRTGATGSRKESTKPDSQSQQKQCFAVSPAKAQKVVISLVYYCIHCRGRRVNILINTGEWSFRPSESINAFDVPELLQTHLEHASECKDHFVGVWTWMYNNI